MISVSVPNLVDGENPKWPWLLVKQLVISLGLYIHIYIYMYTFSHWIGYWENLEEPTIFTVDCNWLTMVYDT